MWSYYSIRIFFYNSTAAASVCVEGKSVGGKSVGGKGLSQTEMKGGHCHWFGFCCYFCGKGDLMLLVLLS